MEKNKTYTALDFARYYAGTMPSAEMNALEKAALEDPFLADALEGYAYSKDPESDVAAIRERLAENRKSKKMFSILSLTQNTWWRVAALVIIIAGAGYLFYRTNNMAPQNSLADNDRTKSPAKVEAPSLVLKDTGANNEVAFENKKVPKADKINRVSLPKPKTVIQHEINNPQPITNANADKEATSLMMAKADPVANNNALPRSINKKDTAKQYMLTGKVTDEIGVPIPNATITFKNKQEETITDTSGSFSLISADSNAALVASAIGFSPKNFLLKKDVQPTITMSRSGANLDEVVITGYATKRKKALAPSRNLQGKVAGVQIKKQAIQPFPVNDKFTKYLQENLVSMYDKNNNRLTGEVVLSFSINKKGRPRNIKVLKSTCEDCEEQAIHLLENGPDWEGRENVAG
ncbi:MAG: carboxypeptidase-like regulatory domain-containing protein, partial [Bacteroidota bacterium]|nr:carboxypeptidase-like regulatory domain-containing protein [Bacteroidota bacterium]